MVIIINAIDFEYDGVLASSLGLIFCQLNGSTDMETIPVGCELNFNQAPIRHGSTWLTTNTSYDAVLETTFQICRYSCSRGIEPLEVEDQREIARWLNQKEPKKFRPITENSTYDSVFFEGSFNLNKLEFNGNVIGYELHFISNAPFALGDTVKRVISLAANTPSEIIDVSDEVGFIYPKLLTIKCLSAGDYVITNKLENRDTKISGCKSGEILTFNDVLDYRSSTGRSLSKSFNFKFFRISNTYSNRVNTIISNLPCEITIEYNPIVKGVGL